jgi:hypothetical protein
MLIAKHKRMERSLFMNADPKMQLLEGKTAAQGHMISKFQMLIANKGLFSQIIDYFPYPIAIFTPQYTLAMVNNAFEAGTKTRFLKKGSARILQYKIDDTQLASAITKVFTGKTFFSEDLKNPFYMFSGITPQSRLQSDRFHRVVVFPVPDDDGKITHGGIMFLP